jgi:uncharacterized Zn-finger protein
MPDRIYLLDEREVVLTQAWAVRCDGNGLLGHPVEFITLAPRGEAVCKYCGRRFVHVSSPVAETVRTRGQPLEALETVGHGR